MRRSFFETGVPPFAVIVTANRAIGGDEMEGETSAPVPSICRQQFITLPGGGGTCGEASLETVTTHWIIQAVFCDNIENADAFCDQMDLTLKQHGMESSNWMHEDAAGCMAP